MAKIKRKRYETDDEYISRASSELYFNGSHISEIESKLKCTKEEAYNAVVNRQYRIMSPEDRDTIIRLVDNGYSYTEVAKMFGKSPKCIRQRYKTPAKRSRGGKEYILTDKELAKIKKLFNDGMTITYIARELGISTKAATWRLKKSGVYVPERSRIYEISPKEIKKYKTLFKKGLTPQQICMKVGRPYRVVYKCLQSEGML